MSTSSSTTVLVTGGSGFLGSYIILALLAQGYKVRTTVRSLSREASVRTSLANGGATASDLARVSFVAASLDNDSGWKEAVQGCVFVHHVASPFPAEVPKHEDELIIPAREGALRILRAASAAGVKRVVLTSSFGAIECGHAPDKESFTEEDWTVLDNPSVKVTPYMKSKTVAEKAAWNYISSDANTSKMELSVVLPVLIQGPVLSKDISTSTFLIQKLMDGSMPGAPNLSYVLVDVRDVASLHLLTMTKPEAAGQRFIGANGDPSSSLVQWGKMIKAGRPQYAKKVPSMQIPNFVVYGLSFFDKPMRQILPALGKVAQASNKKATERMGWKPRGSEETILDSVDSLVEYGLV